MARVLLDEVTKIFRDRERGEVVALDRTSFEVRDGEFLVLVGPSGCGKTTCLRIVAGLERQTSGDVSIGDRVVNLVHPKDRDIAMVFQDYALYPHMSVYDNLAFGLRNLHTPRKVIDEQIGRAAELLQIEHLLRRRPRELSGGQRQRVAVGRAIVRSPQVFLFDEPLSNLDAKLRVQMRVELQDLHRRLGNTVVYVTHDQVEAMTLGDRVVVMNHGVIQQIGAPRWIYERPENMFVAGFIGTPPMNFLSGEVTAEGRFRGDGLDFALPPDLRGGLPGLAGRGVVLGVRPDGFLDAAATAGDGPEAAHIRARVRAVEYLGTESLAYVDAPSGGLTVSLPAQTETGPGAPIALKVDFRRASLFDAETQHRLEWQPMPESPNGRGGGTIRPRQEERE
jgi:multiple sugar transport system ATP-binding protein